MKVLYVILCVTACVVWCAPSLQAGNPTWETILNQIQLRQASQAALLAQMVYRVDSKTQILDSQRHVIREVESQRIVNLNWPDDPLYTFLKMSRDGRQLTPEELRAETERGPAVQPLSSPLHPRMIRHYNFTLKGSVLYHGRDVWEIIYRPIQPAPELSRGKFYIDKAMYDMVYHAYEPAVLRGNIKKMRAKVSYQNIQGVWVPETLILRGHMKTAFIFTFSEQFISVRETFSDFLF